MSVHVKDFREGQEVFVLVEFHGRKIEHGIKVCIVKSVGRKYVKVVTPEGWGEKSFCLPEDDENNYLIGDGSSIYAEKLFLTRQEAEEEVERFWLRRWLNDAATWAKTKKYSYAQLKAVREILEPCVAEVASLSAEN